MREAQSHSVFHESTASDVMLHSASVKYYSLHSCISFLDCSAPRQLLLEKPEAENKVLGVGCNYGSSIAGEDLLDVFLQ